MGFRKFKLCFLNHPNKAKLFSPYLSDRVLRIFTLDVLTFCIFLPSSLPTGKDKELFNGLLRFRDSIT
jgi:hypothetical protein